MRLWVQKPEAKKYACGQSIIHGGEDRQKEQKSTVDHARPLGLSSSSRFFCRRVDYMLGSLDSNRSVPSPKFLVVPFRRGSLQNGTTRLYIGCPLHYFGDRGHVPLWLSERAKRWRQDGGACPCAVSCWWYLCFCFRFLFFLSAYVGDWYWIRSQGDVARALWWWRRRCINCYWSLFSLHTRAPHTTIWVCNRSLGRNNRRETQRPCVDHPNSAPYSDTLLNMVDAS